MKADSMLENHRIEFELVEQKNPTLDCDDAARERGVETSQIVKSLIIESEGELFHACIPGDRTLSEKKLGAEYRLVNPERSEELTGFESGTVHPLSTDLKHLIDERIFEKERVSFTTGEKDRGVIITTDKFRKALIEEDIKFEVSDLVVTEEKDLKRIEQEGVSSEEAVFLMENGYRKLFLESVEEKDAENVVRAIRKLHRQQIDFSANEIEKIIEKSENETHMLKLAENLAEKGELPEDSEFSLEQSVEDVLEENSGAVEDLENGKESAINYLMGKVMEATNGKADPDETKNLIGGKTE